MQPTQLLALDLAGKQPGPGNSGALGNNSSAENNSAFGDFYRQAQQDADAGKQRQSTADKPKKDESSIAKPQTSSESDGDEGQSKSASEVDASTQQDSASKDDLSKAKHVSEEDVAASQKAKKLATDVASEETQASFLEALKALKNKEESENTEQTPLVGQTNKSDEDTELDSADDAEDATKDVVDVAKLVAQAEDSETDKSTSALDSVVDLLNEIEALLAKQQQGEPVDEAKLDKLALELASQMQKLVKSSSQQPEKLVNLAELSQLTQQLKSNLKEMIAEVKPEDMDKPLDLDKLFTGTKDEIKNKSPFLAQFLGQVEDKVKADKPSKNLDLEKLVNQDKMLTPERAVLDKAVAVDTNSTTIQDAKPTTADVSAIQAKSDVNQQQLRAQDTAANLVKQLNAPLNVNKAEFQQGLHERIQVMVSGSVRVAEMRLDPPDLGTMQVRINMNNDQANVSIVVQSQQAKDALDQAIPKLKDLLAEQGIELGESTVQQESKGDKEAQDADGESMLAGESEELDGEEQLVSSTRIVNGALGGIDFYA